MTTADSVKNSIIRNYTTVEAYNRKINNLQWKGFYLTSAAPQGDQTSVKLAESALFLWVRIKVYTFLSCFSNYYNDKYYKHFQRPLRTYTIILSLENKTEKESPKTSITSQQEESSEQSSTSTSLNSLDLFFGQPNEKPAPSPFKESFFKTLPEDLSTLGPLSDLESEVLKSVVTLTKLLRLKVPLSELPKFPIPINSIEGLWSLIKSVEMNKIEHPISFDFDGDGWPFVVIKVLDAEELTTARSIFLHCGPLGSHYIRWNGWWESHNGSSCPSFFSERKFITPSGELMQYSQETIQNFQDLLTQGSAKDENGKKWILYNPKT